MDIPVIVLFFSMPMLNNEGRILDDFKWTHGRLERLIKDIADLADKTPKPKTPSLQEYLSDTYGDK
jgi:hypothetical protein